MIVNGNNITILLNGRQLQTSTNVSLETSRELIQVTTKPTNGFIERIPGQRDGSLSFEGYYDVDNFLYTPGDFVSWRFRAPNGTFYGLGYIDNINYSGGTDEAPTSTGSVQTTGEISFVNQLTEVLCVNGVSLCIDNQELTAQI